MKLTAISGFGTKGPACFLVETDQARLLLDLGKGPDGDTLPDLAGIGHVDAILFSHGHSDHTGGLHLVDRLGNPPLYAPEPTITLSQDMAMHGVQPLESLGELAGLSVETGPAGHAPGASWIRLGGAGGLVYTGDISQESALYRCTLPPPATALVFDASYGTADVPLAGQRDDLLALAGDGPLLLPAPAGGRGLEMALAFLAAGHPVGLCPSHRRVASIVQTRAGWLVPGGPDALAHLLDQSTEIGPDSAPHGVMIAAAANAEGGVAASLAPRIIAEGSGRVVFTGHLAEGKPARDWVDRGQALYHRWNVHPTLTGLRALMDAVGPTLALPAFCTADDRTALAPALDRPLAPTAVIEW